METGLPRCPWGDSALGEGLLSLRGQERASPTDELVPLPRLSPGLAIGVCGPLLFGPKSPECWLPSPCTYILRAFSAPSPSSCCHRRRQTALWQPKTSRAL